MRPLLKPEAMQRTLIVSSKGQQGAVIETLHSLRAAHFIDFQEAHGGDLEGFTIGAPLPSGAPASARLVRVRALLRHLGVEGAEAERTIAVRDLEASLDSRLDQIEGDVSRAIETRDHVRTTLQEGRELEAKLEPLRSIPLRLEDYTGYETVTAYVGRADPAFQAELARVAPDHLLVQGDGQLFALFVPTARAAETSDLLYRNGYAEIEVPAGKGSPDERVRELQAERATLQGRLDKAQQDLRRLAGEHKDFLLAAEEHLGIAVEKAEAPLAFASTENAFVVDAWVPVAAAKQVESAIRAATGDNVYVAFLETSDDHGHDHSHGHGHGDDHHGGVDAAYASHPAAKAPKAVPPTKYANPNATKGFQWFTNLFSVPRYNEIDPTTVFAIFFPLFFGFMIGDLGLGLLMIGLGFLMIRKLSKVDGMKSLGTAIVIAGVVAAVFGGLVFKDALGIPLGTTHHMEDLLEEAGVDPATASCHDIYVHAHEPTWTCLVGGNAQAHAEPLIYKISDIPTMLLLSVAFALVHLLVGLLFGIKNEIGHGAKHVGAKLGFLVLLLTFFPAVLALLRPDMLADYVAAAGDAHPAIAFHLPFTSTQAYLTAGVGLLVGGAILGWAEGIAGIVEVPSMFTAIMSYLRLGAVAIAKGAMAVAFNAMTLVAALEGGGLVLILGIIGFLIAQAVLFVLGLLSGGIQALRLNFVEFFTKFYKGGGTEFKPFGRERRVTTAPATSAPRAAAVTTVLSTLE